MGRWGGVPKHIRRTMKGNTMAHWLNAIDGNFNTKNDWSTGRVPVYNAKHKDDAILDAVGGAYTVTVTTNEDVGIRPRSLPNATLDGSPAWGRSWSTPGRAPAPTPARS